jgi:F-type H+-transporting ATPase subunit gamma
MDALVTLVSDVSSDPDFIHPLLEAREKKGYMLLAIGSDRGMCGAYNANVMRAASEFIAGRTREKLYLLTSGTRVRHLRPRAQARIIRETLRYPRPLPEAYVERIAADITNAFLTLDIARVYFVYTEFHSATGNRPVVRRVLPLMAQPAPDRPFWLLEPNAKELLDRLLPLYVRTAVRQAFLEADASEHAARMVMMEQASVNARSIIAELALTANKLRQNLITRELSDIVGTAEALAG